MIDLSNLKIDEFFDGDQKMIDRFTNSLSDALVAGYKAEESGNSSDTEFEMMFWDGSLCMDEGELFDHFNSDPEEVEYLATSSIYSLCLDMTIYIGSSTLEEEEERKWCIVSYEYKEKVYQLTGWWLESE